MKKNDWILIVIVCLTAAGFWAAGVWGSAVGDVVTVQVDGKTYGTYSLGEDMEIPVHGTNVLVIDGGHAYMKTSDCPDQICVHHKAIAKNGESIICLPNKVIAQVHSRTDNELDAVAQ